MSLIIALKYFIYLSHLKCWDTFLLWFILSHLFYLVSSHLSFLNNCSKWLCLISSWGTLSWLVSLSHVHGTRVTLLWFILPVAQSAVVSYSVSRYVLVIVICWSWIISGTLETWTWSSVSYFWTCLWYQDHIWTNRNRINKSPVPSSQTLVRVHCRRWSSHSCFLCGNNKCFVSSHFLVSALRTFHPPCLSWKRSHGLFWSLF